MIFISKCVSFQFVKIFAQILEFFFVVRSKKYKYAYNTIVNLIILRLADLKILLYKRKCVTTMSIIYFHNVMANVSKLSQKKSGELNINKTLLNFLITYTNSQIKGVHLCIIKINMKTNDQYTQDATYKAVSQKQQ